MQNEALVMSVECCGAEIAGGNIHTGGSRGDTGIVPETWSGMIPVTPHSTGTEPDTTQFQPTMRIITTTPVRQLST